MMVMELTSPGFASTIRTSRTIWDLLAPMDRAASTTPPPSWLRFCSTKRAKYGMALRVSGTMTAAVPMVVPTMNLVTGMIAISRIRNGNERSRLTSPSRTRCSFGLCLSPLGPME
ncbi:hypothetical protein SRABI128_03459 [Microbacterium sp. Bi128]|nr:hypothetical protein SRABI128_03459 [Microbacterium sp. Bi128]